MAAILQKVGGHRLAVPRSSFPALTPSLWTSAFVDRSTVLRRPEIFLLEGPVLIPSVRGRASGACQMDCVGVPRLK